ncbi:MAG: hypothetical protein ACXVY5_04570 [Gaiellales bacterium]
MARDFEAERQQLLQTLREELGLRAWSGYAVATRRVWAALIDPSFYPPIAFTVVDEGAGRRFGAAFIRERHAPLGPVTSTVSESFVLPDEWNDPVTAAIATLNICDPSPGTVTLDGVSYHFLFAGEAELSLRASNPESDGLVTLAESLEEALSSAVELGGSDELRALLRIRPGDVRVETTSHRRLSVSPCPVVSPLRSGISYPNSRLQGENSRCLRECPLQQHRAVP